MRKKLDFATLNLQDALDLAILIEDEAKERYQEFVRQLGPLRSGNATEFFVFMAKNETKHSAYLSAQRKKIFGNNPSTVTQDMLIEIQEAEAPEFYQVRSFMSQRRALEVALACEIKAYNFYDKCLAFVKNQDVKKLFIELKREEVKHQEMVREMLDRTSESLEPEVPVEDVDTPEL
ncbi:MAG: ferritin family protein [Bdellovibrio sp.]|nr:ferritin family protein [Bdellovibrio sp.]